MSKKKIIIGITCLAVVLALGFGGRYGKYLYDYIRYKRIVSEIEIRTFDITQIQDGIYNGFYNAFLVSANVDIVMNGHEIKEIIINAHENDLGSSGLMLSARDVEKNITESVIFQQSLDVDTISGATNSSKVILKAIEAALENGIDTVSGATTDATN